MPRSPVESWTPSQPRVTRPCYLQLIDDSFTVSAGMSKPMPTEPPDGEKIAVLTPITSPLMSNAGPPELPLLIGASI